MMLSIVIFLLVMFAFICGRLHGYADGYSASVKDAKQAHVSVNRNKLSSQEV